jgi:hypothetical protein
MARPQTQPLARDVLLLMARHLTALLGYCNTLRCASHPHRQAALQAEALLGVDDVALPVLHRQTYVSRPLGERLTTVTFQSSRAVLTCTVSTTLGDAQMRCRHCESGVTYAAVVPCTAASGGMFGVVPCVVDGGPGGLLLQTAAIVVRFGSTAAAVLLRDGGDAAHRPWLSKRIGHTRHLWPLYQASSAAAASSLYA